MYRGSSSRASKSYCSCLSVLGLNIKSNPSRRPVTHQFCYASYICAVLKHMRVIKMPGLWEEKETGRRVNSTTVFSSFSQCLSGSELLTTTIRLSQVAWEVKNPPVNARRQKRHRSHPWVGKISWRRAWQPTPVFLPGEAHGQRSLAGYSP